MTRETNKSCHEQANLRCERSSSEHPCRSSTPQIIHKLAEISPWPGSITIARTFGMGFRSPPALIGLFRRRNRFNPRPVGLVAVT